MARAENTVSVIIDVAVPAADFCLGRTLQDADADRIELERIIPTTEAFVPFVRVYNADFGAVETSLENDPDIRAVTLLDEYDDSALFRTEWGPDIDGLFGTINEHNGAILEAVGRDGSDRWEFKLRFPESTNLSAFVADCTDKGVSVDLQRKYNPDDTDLDTMGLTPTQRETLRMAFEGGYFSIPRRTNLTELAAQLDISDQAASERLRRGQARIFASLLFADDHDSGRN